MKKTVFKPILHLKNRQQGFSRFHLSMRNVPIFQMYASFYALMPNNRVANYKVQRSLKLAPYFTASVFW